MPYLRYGSSSCKARQQKSKVKMAKSDNPHEGHRKRMYEKLETAKLSDLPEHEQLEIILFSVIPRGNTNEIAHRLLKRFGSVYAVLLADTRSLAEVDGVGMKTAEFLHNLPSVLGVVMQSKFAYENGNRFIFTETSKVRKFLFGMYADTVTERIMVVYLNKAFRMIKYENINDGSPDVVFVDIRKIVRNAVLSDASYVILSHNHPSGFTSPSEQDRQTTRDLRNALKTIGVGLLDHIIIGGDNYYSFREHLEF